MTAESNVPFCQKDAMCEVCLKKYAVFRCTRCGKLLCINCECTCPRKPIFGDD
jgi:hypothetical protein